MIERLSPDEARTRADAAGVPAALADLNIFGVLLHQPGLARRVADLLIELLGSGRLDPRLRELAIMRLGWSTGSAYEWTQHWHIAVRMGVPASDLIAVRDWRAHAAFGPADRAVLAAVDDVVARGAISDDVWAACRSSVTDDPAVLVELVAVIGLWRMISTVLRSLDIGLEDGLDPWPPDGAHP